MWKDETLLYTALKKKQYDIAALLIKNGAKVDIKSFNYIKKKKLEKNPIVECNKIQNKYYSDLFSRFVEVNDPRNQSYIDYTVKVMLGVLYYKCIGGISSMQELKIRRSISIRVKKK